MRNIGVIKDIAPEEGKKETLVKEDPKVESQEVSKPEPAQEKKVPKEEVKEEEKVEKKEELENKVEIAEPEEDWETKYKKLEEERDNYKNALLSTKYKTLSLGDNKKVTTEKKSKWDEVSDEFQKDTIKRVDKLVAERLEKNNEQGAIKRFLKKNPAIATNSIDWGEVVSFYKSHRGKETVDDIVDDLEDAYLSVRRKNGTLDNDVKEAKQEGERKGVIKAKVAQMASVSGTGGRPSSKQDTKKGLSDTAKYMADKMGTPISELEEAESETTSVIKF